MYKNLFSIGCTALLGAVSSVVAQQNIPAPSQFRPIPSAPVRPIPAPTAQGQSTAQPAPGNSSATSTAPSAQGAGVSVGRNSSLFPGTNAGLTNSPSVGSLEQIPNNSGSFTNNTITGFATNVTGVPLTNIIVGFTTNAVSGFATNVVAGFSTNIIFLSTNTIAGSVTNIIGGAAAGAAPIQPGTIPAPSSVIPDVPANRAPNLPPLVPSNRTLGTPPLL